MFRRSIISVGNCTIKGIRGVFLPLDQFITVARPFHEEQSETFESPASIEAQTSRLFIPFVF